MTVAAGSVLKADDVLFGLLPKACIPVLAIYGNQDSMGRESSMKLVHLANAKSLELEGKHPCYLDSPDAFVRAVIDFVDATEKGKQECLGLWRRHGRKEVITSVPLDLLGD